MKSAYDLALERMESQGIEKPDAGKLGDDVKAQMAEVRAKAGAELAQVEILHKQRSLKGVLEPFSTQGNLDLLKRAGFVDIMTVMKWVCFEGFLAIK